MKDIKKAVYVLLVTTGSWPSITLGTGNELPEMATVYNSLTFTNIIGPERTAEICMVAIESGYWFRVTDNEFNDFDPVFSPDGSKISFVSTRDGNSEIYVMNVDGSDQVNLTNHSASDFWPVWSPDGKKIAFLSERDGNVDIYSINADGSDLINLTSNEGCDNEPVWSPDGTKIAFTINRDGDKEVYIMDADGSGQANLSDNSLKKGLSEKGFNSWYIRSKYVHRARHLEVWNDFNPSWSPDCKKVIFASERDGNYEIYIADADGSDIKNITNKSSEDTEPIWSFDGTKIVYTSKSYIYGESDIYVINPDGSGRKRIRKKNRSNINPCFSPYGDKIAFLTNGFYGTRWYIHIINTDGSEDTALIYTNQGPGTRGLIGNRLSFSPQIVNDVLYDTYGKVVPESN